MTTLAKIAIAVLAVLAAAGLYYALAPRAATTAPVETATTTAAAATSSAATSTTARDPAAPSPKPAPADITMAQVAAHGGEASCWTAIGGQVYDLTAWISEHPGGERAILSICGKDGTAAFQGQHGGQSRPEATLATFKIGALAS